MWKNAVGGLKSSRVMSRSSDKLLGFDRFRAVYGIQFRRWGALEGNVSIIN